ncbi:MAG: ROK family protein [Firmicutes bacterium]|nr:ROK family protein [Bacillota bacterium]
MSSKNFLHYIGIDIGGTSVKLGLVTAGGKIVEQISFKTHGAREPEALVNQIAQAIKELSPENDFVAIGVGCPGAVNSKDGIVEYWSNLQWHNVPLASMIANATGKSVKIANDANVAALGEHKFGAGKDYTDTAMITLGTGVGGGFVVDGKLFEGYRSMGTEVGHMVIRENGIQCTCGRRGCFEVYASATALIRETRAAMQNDKNKESMMWDYLGLDKTAQTYDVHKIDGRATFACAKQGDIIAMQVADAYIKSLAEGVTNVVNIFRSQAVILGGGVCNEKTLAKRVQEYVDKFRYGGANSLPTKVLIAKLGNDAGIIGAASLVIEN